MEEWKDVEGYEGLYQVSNEGDNDHSVRNTKRNNFKKSYVWGNGYVYVQLSKNHKSKPVALHRIKADAFVYNDDKSNKTFVNHKNEDKTDNRIENLEWCTAKYNNNYGTHNERMREQLTNRKDLSTTVYQYTLDGKLVKIWESTRECGRYGFNSSTISKCCRGLLKKHKGYRWSYKPL